MYCLTNFSSMRVKTAVTILDVIRMLRCRDFGNGSNPGKFPLNWYTTEVKSERLKMQVKSLQNIGEPSLKSQAGRLSMPVECGCWMKVSRL